MKKSQAIDLTMIGMGYFKAIEQLLFDLICLHKNENRFIRKDLSRTDLPGKNILLSEFNINNKAIDTTIGAIAKFYKEKLDMLRDDISCQTKKYICETIFFYKNLRNGYLHKDNIHSWDKIDEIRFETFFIIFLLLGTHTLNNNHMLQLGLPDIEEISDYSLLCEYVNYHNGELFFLSTKHDENIIAIACCDMHSKTIDNRYIKYSGAYFKIMDDKNRIYVLSKNKLPKEIYLGKLNITQSDTICMNPKKVKKIFENGKYIGPSIIEEDNINY